MQMRANFGVQTGKMKLRRSILAPKTHISAVASRGPTGAYLFV